MIKSVATKVRIENRREAKKIFNRSTRKGREAYREFLRGIILSKPYYELCRREALGLDD